MMVLISLPVWFAGFASLLIGLVGMFTKSVTGNKALLALAMIPTSSLFFYAAARMCGIVP